MAFEGSKRGRQCKEMDRDLIIKLIITTERENKSKMMRQRNEEKNRIRIGFVERMLEKDQQSRR